jgi:hypothetical protein
MINESIDWRLIRAKSSGGYCIANWVNKDSDDLSLEVKDYEPIPITPELLERCAFEVYTTNSATFYKHPSVRWVLLQVNETLVYSVPDFQGAYLFQGDVKYLHNLQNLYFALTSEELKLNL